jgi:cytochrome c2
MASSACSTFSPGSEPVPTVDPLEIGDPENGAKLFETGGELAYFGCVACHTLDGSEADTIKHGGPSLLGISERAGSRVADTSAEDYLRESILDPSAYVVEGYGNDMEKAYRYLLSEDEINDLIAFLLTQ